MPIATVPYAESPLDFLVEDSASLNVSLVDVTAELLDDTLDRVDITFLVSPADYARIDAQALFHLTPEVRGPGSQRAFRDDAPIEIEARLHPNGLRLIENEVDSIDEIGDYLLMLSREAVEHALLSADSWYVLRVKQEEVLPLEFQSPGRSLKSGYSTTWLESLTSDQEISPVIAVLIETLNAEGWNWSRGTDPSALMSRLATDHPDERWTVYTKIREEEHCL